MIKPDEFKGKNVLVMGLGLHGGGTGVVRYMCRHGAKVTVTDLRGKEQLKAAIDELRDYKVNLVLGEHREEDFRKCDIVEINPAIPPNSPFLKIIKERGIPTISALDIVFSTEDIRFFGITGSNGKTTTSHLFYEILKSTDKKTILGGNVGGSLLDIIDDITENIQIVMELSSFQLQRLQVPKSPSVAIITNFSPNHLDWHSNLSEYAAAKKRIFKYQSADDTTVLYYDSPTVSNWKKDCPGRVLFFSRTMDVKEGACVKAGSLILRDGNKERTICKVDDIFIPGKHNIENCLAAAAGAIPEGIPTDKMAEVFRTFRGVEHRLEFVENVNGVSYYDDSSSTTPDSVVVAMHAFKEPKILILGGSDKGLSYDSMVKEIMSAKVRGVILIGQAGKTIGECISAVREKGLPRIQHANSMLHAVEIAAHLAKSGDVVLLTPGCASFDMFRNYQERGNQFKEFVRQIIGK